MFTLRLLSMQIFSIAESRLLTLPQESKMNPFQWAYDAAHDSIYVKMQSWNKYNCPEDIFCELLYICFMKWPNLLQDSVLCFHRQFHTFFYFDYRVSNFPLPTDSIKSCFVYVWSYPEEWYWCPIILDIFSIFWKYVWVVKLFCCFPKIILCTF